MLLTKLKIVTAAVLVIAVVGSKAALFSVRSLAAEPQGTKFVPSPQPENREAKDEEKIQGTWKMAYAEVRGQPLPQKEIADLKLVFKGKKHILYKGDAVNAIGGHRLDPTRKPKTIDITEEEGPNKGNSNRGIYLLMDDLFIVCYNFPSMERPTEFTSKPDSIIYLFIYKRVKP